jgi:hypothetical protein
MTEMDYSKPRPELEAELRFLDGVKDKKQLTKEQRLRRRALRAHLLPGLGKSNTFSCLTSSLTSQIPRA